MIPGADAAIGIVPAVPMGGTRRRLRGFHSSVMFSRSKGLSMVISFLSRRITLSCWSFFKGFADGLLTGSGE